MHVLFRMLKFGVEKVIITYLHNEIQISSFQGLTLTHAQSSMRNKARKSPKQDEELT